MLNYDQDRIKKLMDASMAAFETLLKHKARLFPSELSEDGEKMLSDSIYRFKKLKENLHKTDLTSEVLEQYGFSGPQMVVKLKSIEFFNKKLEKAFAKEEAFKLIEALRIPLESLAESLNDLYFVVDVFDLLDLLGPEAKDAKPHKR
jgi:hypothetical protein